MKASDSFDYTHDNAVKAEFVNTMAPDEWATFGTPAWKEPILQAALFAIPTTTITCVVVTWFV